MYTVPFCGMKKKANDEMTVTVQHNVYLTFFKTSLKPLTALPCTILRK